MLLHEIIKELKNINNNSIVTISSCSKEDTDFTLYQKSYNEYTVYVSDNVKNIGWLFSHNKKVKKIMFDDWNSSNLTRMDYSFAGVKLDSSPDFSNQDFSNVKSFIGIFNNTTVNGNLYFINHTFEKLKECTYMFEGVTCDNLEVDLGKTLIKNANYMFASIKCNTLKAIIRKTGEMNFNYAFEGSNINKINLKKFNLSECISFLNFMIHLETKEIYLPKDTPKSNNDIGFISNKIDKIYCEKDWIKLLNKKVDSFVKNRKHIKG